MGIQSKLVGAEEVFRALKLCDPTQVITQWSQPIESSQIRVTLMQTADLGSSRWVSVASSVVINVPHRGGMLMEALGGDEMWELL